MKNLSFYQKTIAAGFAVLAAGPALAASQDPVVVELFTSQGCSSCPPANANLVKLSTDANVLALSFAVTYWDYLGWKDSFGKPEFTQRQVTYEPGLGQTSPFTPQMVINGRTSTVGQDIGEVRRLVSAEKPLTGPAVTLKQGAVVIGQGQRKASVADIWLVRYDAGLVEVPVKRGENAGETLPHAHVVRQLIRLGTWSGSSQTLTLPASKLGQKYAVLIQEPNGGEMLAAATN